MNKSRFAFALVFAILVVAAAASNAWSPSVLTAQPVVAGTQEQDSAACADQPADLSDDSDTSRVPPGCCTSNCNVDGDCDRICGKGNCVCVIGNSCCRRCSW